MTSGDQFSPIDKPYLKQWQERMGSIEEKPKPKRKKVKHDARRRGKPSRV